MAPPTEAAEAAKERRGEAEAPQLQTSATTGCLARLRRAWSANFVARIAATCGLKFMLVTLIVYGVDQGAKRALLDLTRVYFYKDRGLTPGARACVRSARARRRPGAHQLTRDAHSLTHSVTHPLARSLRRDAAVDRVGRLRVEHQVRIRDRDGHHPGTSPLV